jgi:hypothetical protein
MNTARIVVLANTVVAGGLATPLSNGPEPEPAAQAATSVLSPGQRMAAGANSKPISLVRFGTSSPATVQP